MNTEVAMARSAIESLRSGVPSRRAVAQLGTTQHHARDQFDAALTALAAGERVAPLIVAANFGAGKSHLLEYFQSLAEQQGIVTSFVVVSPEMPLGNAHAVLKAIAENALAPGRLGKAISALAPDIGAGPTLGRLREWARSADVNERFRALLYLYEEYRADPEFRAQVLDDFEGKPLPKSAIRLRLKETGAQAAYDLGPQKTALQAHDRIRLLAQIARACGCKGLVLLIDELERIAQFSLPQRSAAYRELGWWTEIARQEDAAILPVFAMTENFIHEFVAGGRNDARRFMHAMPGYVHDDREELAAHGIDALKTYNLLESAAQHDEEVKYRIKALYELAYGVRVPSLPKGGNDVRITIRSEIRRWITLWDLYRYYPDYMPRVEEESVAFDTAEISDANLADGSDEEPAEE